MMKMVIVYWLSINSKKENDIDIYYKVYSFFSETIGYKNSFGHEVVSIQCYDEKLKKFITINSYFDLEKEDDKISLKNKLINKTIDFLEKLKKR